MAKKILMVVFVAGLLFVFPNEAAAQCAICTKTAQQLGDKPAKALNGAIIYLAAAPLLMIGFIGYRWWKNNR
jgi:UPF0716 family protein affecting phage T7 exclusion